MTDEKAKIDDLDRPLRQALDMDKKSLDHLKKALSLIDKESELDDEDAMRFFRLTLQYRMDKEDVIKKLLKLNKRLCAALGISEGNSIKKNLDSCAYQLGNDNLHHELSLVKDIASKLNKMLVLCEHTHKLQEEEKKLYQRIKNKLSERFDLSEESLDAKKQQKAHTGAIDSIAGELRNAITFQEYFANNIEQLTEAYHVLPGLPKHGLIHDYLAGLKGPINQFHMAVQNGIVSSDEVLNVLGRHLGLEHKTVNTNRLITGLTKEVEKNYQVQRQFLQTLQNQKRFFHDLDNALNRQNQVTQSLQQQHHSKRFDESAKLRRTMNLFNR